MCIKRTVNVQNIKRQQGWTFWSLLFVLSLVLFFGYVGMQLVPVYSANDNVKNAMKRSLDDPNLVNATRSTIIRKIGAQLYLDGSHKLLNYKTDLNVRRSKKKFIIEINYEREVPLFYNLYILVKFNNVEETVLNQRAN